MYTHTVSAYMCVYTSVTEFVQVDWLFEHINLNAEFTLHGGGGGTVIQILVQNITLLK